MQDLFNSWQCQLKNSSTKLECLSSNLSKVVKKYRFLTTPYSQKFFTQSEVLKNIYLPKIEEISLSYKNPSDDIMGDKINEVFDGVIHKYKNRVLLLVSLDCSMYCRYCTRKNSTSNIFDLKNLPKLYDYTKKSQVDEIILSGGDPFILDNSTLKEYLKTFSEWEHINTVRIHTKSFASLPMRFFDEELLEIIEKYSQKLWIVTHFVSSEEFNELVQKAIKNVQKCGVVLLNQNPVLKGINNSVEQLKNLFKTLIKNKIKPYYLFQIDQVDGTAHFNVDLSEVLSIFEVLQREMSGIALPKIIVDLPGGAGKVPVGVNYLLEQKEEFYRFKSPKGEIVDYNRR